MAFRYYEPENEEETFDIAKAYGLEPPRRRPMNNDDTDDFIAIDFETMTGKRTSACAVGMVKVIDGEIVQQFYSLINPVRDEYTDKEPNRMIHGISLEMAEKAPTFEELFDTFKSFIGGYPLVCHGRGADIAIFDQLMEYYKLSGIDTENSICTYGLTGKSLAKCCEEYKIPLGSHHNALCDAEACARLYLHLIGKPIIQTGGGSFENYESNKNKNKNEYAKRIISKEHRERLDDCQIARKDTIFFNSTVVITGTFNAYPDRDSLASDLQKLGAKVCSSISKKTTHVIVGVGAGPKKIDKIKELQQEGFGIKMVHEHELVKILDV